MRKLGLFENQKLKEFTKWDSGFQNQRIRKIRKEDSWPKGGHACQTGEREWVQGATESIMSQPPRLLVKYQLCRWRLNLYSPCSCRHWIFPLPKLYPHMSNEYQYQSKQWLPSSLWEEYNLFLQHNQWIHTQNCTNLLSSCLIL